MYSKNDIQFKNFTDVESTMYVLFNFIHDKKIRFIEPDKPILWERTLIDCAYFLKIIKSIEVLRKAFNERYRIVYKRPFFVTFDTYSIKKDKDSYDLIIKTPDWTDDLFYHINIKFKSMMTQCERTLPKYEFEKLYERIERIANQTGRHSSL